MFNAETKTKIKWIIDIKCKNNHWVYSKMPNIEPRNKNEISVSRNQFNGEISNTHPRETPPQTPPTPAPTTIPHPPTTLPPAPVGSPKSVPQNILCVGEADGGGNNDKENGQNPSHANTTKREGGRLCKYVSQHMLVINAYIHIKSRQSRNKCIIMYMMPDTISLISERSPAKLLC